MSRARRKISAFVPSVTAASRHCPAMRLSPVGLFLSRACACAVWIAASLQPHLLALGHSTRADRRYLIARHKSGMLVIVRHLARDGERAKRTAEIRTSGKFRQFGLPCFRPTFVQSLISHHHSFSDFLDCFLSWRYRVFLSIKFPGVMCLIYTYPKWYLKRLTIIMSRRRMNDSDSLRMFNCRFFSFLSLFIRY